MTQAQIAINWKDSVAVPRNGPHPVTRPCVVKAGAVSAADKEPVDTAPNATTSRPAWYRRVRRVILRALEEATTDQVSLAAAGCAFYATLALFPAISVLISVYGLAFNVQAVEQQLQVME